MYEILLGLAEKGKLNKAMLDTFVARGWITKEQEEEILKIAEENEHSREGVNHDGNNNR